MRTAISIKKVTSQRVCVCLGTHFLRSGSKGFGLEVEWQVREADIWLIKLLEDV